MNHVSNNSETLKLIKFLFPADSETLKFIKFLFPADSETLKFMKFLFPADYLSIAAHGNPASAVITASTVWGGRIFYKYKFLRKNYNFLQI